MTNSTNTINRLNWQYLEDNYSGMIQEIFSLYLEFVDLYTQNLIDAFKEKNSKTIASAAHTLKGASANIGAEKIAFFCKVIEENANKNSQDNVEKNLDDLQLELNELKLDLELFINTNQKR